MSLTFHLIPNAHLDPVWLWDWREGLNEGLTTCRTVLDLMDEFPSLTFTRGECAIYDHILKTDPYTFDRIRAYINSKRWEVVGGNVIQPDTNLPATEALMRQFVVGKSWFHEHFGVAVDVGWAADSFGHAEGLPEILHHAGLRYFAFTRPPQSIVPLTAPVFWWLGRSGCRVLAFRPQVGWYGSSRNEMPGRLDEMLKLYKDGPLRNVGVPFGLGNHGGGPVRQQIQQVAEWSERHPEVTVIYSSFANFFASIEKELSQLPEEILPVHSGELNFVMRGCYSSAAKLKYLYRRTEAALIAAEQTTSVLSAALNTRCTNLTDAWYGLLFNGFHDILPGSSIERALNEQIEWLGGVQHDIRSTSFRVLNQLAAAVDTTVAKPENHMPSGIAFLAWNPHPWPYHGLLELEGCLDYRPIDAYTGIPEQVPILLRGLDGTPLSYQRVATEGSFGANDAWRARLVTVADIPAYGWSVFEMAWDESAKNANLNLEAAEAIDDCTISNGIYTVIAAPGTTGIRIIRYGQNLLADPGLSLVTIEDHDGSWGAMDEDPAKLDANVTRGEWTIEQVRVQERGPLRAALWVRLRSLASWVEFTLRLTAGRDVVDCDVRLFWAERSARLKLVLPGASSAEYDVPGGSVTRNFHREVPGGKWVRVTNGDYHFGFASDSLYGFDLQNEQLRPTLIRGTRNASDATLGPDEQLWQPATDLGEHRLRFVITGDVDNLAARASELVAPPMVILATPSNGRLPRHGSFAALQTDGLELLALKPAMDGRGWIIRVQEKKGKTATMRLRWLDQEFDGGQIPPYHICTFRISGSTGSWIMVHEPGDELPQSG